MFDDLRSAWGAAKPRHTPTYVQPATRTEFFVHYDGGAAVVVSSHADCLARVKQDQAFHMSGRGWSDIGYNGLVCQHGRAIEGRGIDYAGAHCPDHNTSGYGFQFMVGGDQEPTPAAKARMRKLYDDCCDHSHRTLSKRGHRDGFATACPGDSIYAWVRAGMPAPTKEDDVTPEQLRAAIKAELNDPAFLRNVARFVLTGLPTGPEGNQLVLAGHLSKIEALAAADLTPEQIKAAVREALDSKYDATVVLSEKEV